jgi:hypothetical protein
MRCLIIAVVATVVLVASQSAVNAKCMPAESAPPGGIQALAAEQVPEDESSERQKRSAAKLALALASHAAAVAADRQAQNDPDDLSARLAGALARTIRDGLLTEAVAEALPDTEQVVHGAVGRVVGQVLDGKIDLTGLAIGAAKDKLKQELAKVNPKAAEIASVIDLLVGIVQQTQQAK